MSVLSVIGDGKTKNKARVEDDSLFTHQIPFPPLIKQKTNPFLQFLTDDGTDSGSNEMAVDGSLTNIDFFIKASETADRYVTNLNFLVAYGATGAPFEWADGTTLTNGSRLFYENDSGEHNIHAGIKSNQDIFRLELSVIPSAWELRHTNASNDFGYFISLDLRALGLQFGVKLDKGSSQRLIMRIRDNTGTDADTFNCIAYGFERF